MGEIADMMIEGFLDSETGELIDGDSPGYPRTMQRQKTKQRSGPKCPECGKRLRSEQGLVDHCRDAHASKVKCERTMRSKDWTGHLAWKCGRQATHKQADGLPLCEMHFNKMQRKFGRM